MALGTRFFRPRLVPPARHREQYDAAIATARAEQFRAVMLPHLDSAYSFARYLARDATVAEDIVQDAFLRAFRSFDSWRGDSAKAWLLSIVRNCFLNSVVGRDRHSGTERVEDLSGAALDVADADTPETILAQRNEAAMLRNMIESLPEPFRETLVLRELEELSYKEIAEVTRTPIGTVMSRLWRARRLLVQAATEQREAS